MSSSEDRWNKAERLAVAGVVAPSLRSQGKAAIRRVGRLDKNGKVVGYTTLAEVQKALLLEKAIELDVVDGVRPEKVLCKWCGRIITTKRRSGPPPQTCPDGCRRRCATPDCDGDISKETARRAARGDRLGFCRTCSIARAHSHLSPEQRRANLPQLSADERSRNAKKGSATLSDEQRSERSRKAYARRAVRPIQVTCKVCGQTFATESRGGQHRSVCPGGCLTNCATEGCGRKLKLETARRANKNGRPGLCRSCVAKARLAALAPEERSEIVKKGNAVRRNMRADRSIKKST